LNDAGRAVQSAWEDLPKRFSTVELDAFVVMPNHVHGILIIVANDVAPITVGAGLVPAQGATTRVAPTVSEIVGAFKSLTTVNYIRGVRDQGWPAFRGRLWQRSFHDHIRDLHYAVWH
jgi:putative transposase